MTDIRQTGRTTRMLEYALKAAAEENKHVRVVGFSQKHCQRLMSHFLGLTESKDLQVIRRRNKLRFPDSEGFVSFDIDTWHRDWNWQEMRVRGDFPETILLVDHWAIEMRFQEMIEMLRRFEK